MTAIELYERPDVAGVLQLTATDVACKVRLRRVDRRRGIAAYQIALANKTAADVSCRLFTLDKHAGETDLALLHVGAHSLGGSQVTVPLGACRNGALIHVEIIGTGLQVCSQTRLPRRPQSLPWRTLAGAALVVGALDWLVISPPAAIRPSVALSAPAGVHPGLASAAYAFERGTSARYTAIGSDGSVLAGGQLTNASGILPLMVPDGMIGRTVRIKLEAYGPFGIDSKSVTFGVSAAPQGRTPAAFLPTARILALTAHRETYAGTTSVLASYLAMADSGTVLIRDAHGRPIVEAPFVHGGTSRIALPAGLRGEALRAEVAVTRGTSHVTASVELPPEPIASSAVPGVPLTLAPVARSTASDLAPMASGDSIPQPSDPFAFPGRVGGGTVLDVTINRRLPDMRVALQDEVGTTLDERDVPAGAANVHLNVPPVSALESFYVVCTFTRDASEETLVRSLRVSPR